MKSFLLLLFVSLTSCEDIIVPPKESLRYIINEFRRCPELPDTPIKMDVNLKIVSRKRDIVYNATLSVLQRVTNDYKLRLEVTKCLDRYSGNSCEHYWDYEYDNMCDNIAKENEIWSHFVRDIEGFPLKCPIEQGTYEINEKPFQVNHFFPGMPLTYAFWRVRIVGMLNDKVMHCNNLEFETYMKRQPRPSTNISETSSIQPSEILAEPFESSPSETSESSSVKPAPNPAGEPTSVQPSQPPSNETPEMHSVKPTPTPSYEQSTPYKFPIMVLLMF